MVANKSGYCIGLFFVDFSRGVAGRARPSALRDLDEIFFGPAPGFPVFLLPVYVKKRSLTRSFSAFVVFSGPSFPNRTERGMAKKRANRRTFVKIC
jgi:hypothetical protein